MATVALQKNAMIFMNLILSCINFKNINIPRFKLMGFMNKI